MVKRPEFTVLGLGELDRVDFADFEAVVSILDPGRPPAVPEGPRRLELRCHDIVEDLAGQTAPSAAMVAQLLAFGRELHTHGVRRVLVHCHLGVSRSPAAAYVLMAQAWPKIAPERLFRNLVRRRPAALPNHRIVALGDAALGRGGALLPPVERRLSSARWLLTRETSDS